MGTRPDPRPQVHVNVATSADGKLALPDGSPIRLSGPEDHARVHGLRARCDAILVGVGTVLADDPRLTARPEGSDIPPANQPLRVVLDTHGRTPPDARVLDGSAPTLLITGDPTAIVPGAETVVCEGDPVDLDAALRTLASRGIEHLLVEGGGSVIMSFLQAQAVDRLTVYIAPTIIGGDGPTLAHGDGARGAKGTIPLELVDVARLGEGALLTYRGPAY